MDPESISELRDFAEQTLAKNGTDEDFTPDTLSVSKINDADMRDFAEETLVKNDTAANLKLDTLSAPIVNNIFLAEHMPVFEDARESFLYITNQNNCPIFFSQFFKSKVFNYFILLKYFTNFQNNIFDAHRYQFWFSYFYSRI